jgi:3-phosphoshikimate 1-carboxyvinyltransferase
VAVEPGPLRANDIAVPGDISAAAFFLVAASIHPDAKLRVTGVGMNPSRTAVLDALRRMGAQVRVENPREVGGEPVADVVAESSALRGIEIAGDEAAGLIDELPVLAVAACLAQGTTVIRDAAELRTKESDRITSMAQGLSRMGARIEELRDGMVIHGPTPLHGATCRSYGDHRVAMSLAVAGLVAGGETVIQGAECAAISYPGFWDQLQAIAMGGGDGPT